MNIPFFESIIDETEDLKTRKVTIHKPDVYNDIDSVTYKFTDAQTMPTPRQENAVASDASESLDRKLIVSLVDFRDAYLRQRLQTMLAEEVVEEADDITDLEKYYFYVFRLSTSYRDSTLKPLATFIHRYLVWGALFDWFSHVGITAQARIYESKLAELENDIISNLRSPSRAKRPLQPFGPSKNNPIIW